jgi:hypothetical protein
MFLRRASIRCASPSSFSSNFVWTCLAETTRTSRSTQTRRATPTDEFGTRVRTSGECRRSASRRTDRPAAVTRRERVAGWRPRHAERSARRRSLVDRSVDRLVRCNRADRDSSTSLARGRARPPSREASTARHTSSPSYLIDFGQFPVEQIAFFALHVFDQIVVVARDRPQPFDVQPTDERRACLPRVPRDKLLTDGLDRCRAARPRPTDRPASTCSTGRASHSAARATAVRETRRSSRRCVEADP